MQAHTSAYVRKKNIFLQLHRYPKCLSLFLNAEVYAQVYAEVRTRHQARFGWSASEKIGMLP